MNNTEAISENTNTVVAVLKLNTPLPQLLHHMLWAIDELDVYHQAFKTIFPRSLYKFVKKTAKIDRNVLKTLIKDHSIREYVLSFFKDFKHKKTILIYTHELCDIILSSKDANRILRRIYKSIDPVQHSTAQEAEVLPDLDEAVQLQGLSDFIFGERTIETMEDITSTLNAKVPDVNQQISMLETLANASAGVTGSFDNLQKTLSELIGCFPQAARTAESVTDKATDAADKAARSVNSLNDSLKYLSKIVSLAGVSYAAYRLASQPSMKNVTITLASIALAIYTIGWDNIKEFFSNLGSNIFALVTKALLSFSGATPKATEPELQSDNFEYAGLFGKIFDSLPKGSISRLSAIMRLSKDLPEFLDSAFNFIKVLLDKATGNYFGFDTVESMFDATDKLNAAYRTVVQQVETKQFAITFENAVKVDSLLDGYTQLFIKLDAKRRNNFSRIVSDKIRVLTKIQTHLTQFFSINKGFRKEPVTICLQGPPGIYKSELTAQLCDIALAITISKQEIDMARREDLVYTRNSLDPFWSNFPPTALITLFDDYDQARDSVGASSSCHLDLIAFVNTAPFAPPQPDVESKGKTFNTCPWGFGNTNQTEFKPYSLHHKEAIDRRWDLLVTPIPLERYADKQDPSRLDVSTMLTDTEGVYDISLDKYMFKCIPNGRKDAAFTLSYPQLVEEMKRLYALKSARFKANSLRRQKLASAISETMNLINQKKAKAQEEIRQEKLRAAAMQVTPVQVQSCAEDQLVPMKDMNFADDDDIEIPDLQTDFDFFFHEHFTHKMDDTVFDSMEPQYVPLGMMYHKVPIAQKLTAALELLSLMLMIRGVNEEGQEALRNAADPAKHMPWQSYQFFRNHLGDAELTLYFVHYCICTMAYGRIKDEAIPSLFESLDPFVFFILLCKKDERYGEWLFRGYKFSQVELSQVDCLIRMDRPFLDAVKDISMNAVQKALQWRLSITNPFIAFVVDVAFFYTTFSLMSSGFKAVLNLTSMGISFIVSKFYPSEEEQSTQPRHNKTVTVKARVNASAKVQHPVELQAGDGTGLDLAKKLNKSNANHFTILDTTIDATSAVMFGDVLWLDSQTFICPEHYLTRLKDKSDEYKMRQMVLILTPEGESIYEISVLDFIDRSLVTTEGDSHLMWHRLNEPISQRKKDISSYFITDADLHSLSNDDLDMIMKVNSDKGVYRTSSAEISTFYSKQLNLRIAKCLKYKIDTGEGDCGVPIMLRCPRLGKRRIAGIHVAGTYKGYHDRNAWCTILTQEMIAENYTRLSAFTDSMSCNVQEQGAEFSFCHSPYKVNKIIPSVLASTSFPKSTKLPALLLPKNGLDPYAKAVAHYSVKRELSYDKETYKRATDDLVSYLCSFPYSMDYELLTIEQALWGDPNNPYYSAIPSSTSAGFPFKYTNKNYKARLLGPDALRNGNNPYFPEFKQRIWHLITQANAGIREEYYYTNNLKQSLVSIKKRNEGETRLFSGAGFELVVVTKVLWGPAVEFASINCVDKGMATTVNVYSEEWKHIAMKLGQFSPSLQQAEALPIDYSKFDASQQQEILLNSLDVWNRWFAYHGFTKYEKARSTIFLEVSKSKHVVFALIEEWEQGLPSGSYLTLLVNSTTNLTNVRYCYYQLTPERYNTIPFHKVAYVIVQGDDLALSVADSIKEFMTADGIESSMLSMGFIVTSDVKNEPIKFKKLTDITFLKRSFRIEGENVFGALSMDTIMNTPMWSKNDEYYMKITKDAIKFFFREISLHDADTFNEKATLMRQAIREARIRGVDGLFSSQEEWRRQVYLSEPFTFEL